MATDTPLTSLLRTAIAEDSESVLSILTQSRAEYLPYAVSPHSISEIRQWVKSHLIPTGRVIIAQVENVDVGVLATSVDDDTGWIDQLYIAPGYIEKGVGRALLCHAMELLPRPIQLWTFQQNSRAIGFYESHGFKAVEYTTGDRNEENCPDILFKYTETS